MIKILRSGFIKNKPMKKFFCQTCGCVFKTDEYELRGYSIGGIWSSKQELHATCPECKTIVIKDLY